MFMKNPLKIPLNNIHLNNINLNNIFPPKSNTESITGETTTPSIDDNFPKKERTFGYYFLKFLMFIFLSSILSGIVWLIWWISKQYRNNGNTQNSSRLLNMNQKTKIGIFLINSMNISKRPINTNVDIGLSSNEGISSNMSFGSSPTGSFTKPPFTIKLKDPFVTGVIMEWWNIFLKIFPDPDGKTFIKCSTSQDIVLLINTIKCIIAKIVKLQTQKSPVDETIINSKFTNEDFCQLGGLLFPIIILEYYFRGWKADINSYVVSFSIDTPESEKIMDFDTVNETILFSGTLKTLFQNIIQKFFNNQNLSSSVREFLFKTNLDNPIKATDLQKICVVGILDSPKKDDCKFCI